MKVLVGCEFSQRVTKAFRDKGHDAISCDIIPTEGNPDWHIQDDVLKHINEGIDLFIVFPVCRYLCSSGIHWNNKIPGRKEETEKALKFVKLIMDSPINKIAIENPIGVISTRIRKPDQIIQPWWFGENASKATCLWLKNLPKLVPTNIIRKHRYANQTASGQNKLPPSDHRWKDRSRTYKLVAEAMASQWSDII